MKQKTTYQFFKRKSFKIIFTTFITIISCNCYAQLLFSNGPISTGATHVATSTTAPTSYTWSELQTPAGTLGFSTFYNNALSSDFSLAEEFVVPVGQTWNVTNVNVYGYQTNYAGTTIPIDVLRIRIWNGDPSLGTSAIVYGNMTTNVLNAAGSGEEFIYRVATTTGTTRKVWRFNAAIATSLVAGTYWLEYQVHAINDASIFCPPVTILGTQSDPSWTAKQRTAATWAGMIDTGSTFNRAIAFQLLDSTLGLNSNELTSSFKMYPIPARETLNLKWNEKSLKEAKSVSIYDLRGSLVLNENSISNNSDFSVNISTLKTGMYLVKIIGKDGKTIFTDKFVKE